MKFWIERTKRDYIYFHDEEPVEICLSDVAWLAGDPLFPYKIWKRISDIELPPYPLLAEFNSKGLSCVWVPRGRRPPEGWEYVE